MFCCFGISILQAQTNETFDGDTTGGVSFSEGGVTFNYSSTSDGYRISALNGLGWDGTAADNQFLDHDGSGGASNGTQLTIVTSDGSDFTIKSFWVYLAQLNGISTGSGNLTIQAEKDDNEVFTFTKTADFNTPSGSQNGFTEIDFATETMNDFSNENIDELNISTTGTFDYLALDAFTFDVASTPATTFTALADLCINAGEQTGLGGGSPAGGVYSGTGITDEGNGMTYSFNPATAGGGTTTITYTVNSDPATDDVEVFGLPMVSFTALSDLCVDAGVQTGQGGGLPTGGIYSGPGITDDGNGMTYSFNPATAGIGTHTITYSFTDTNSCGGSATDDVEVFGLPVVSFTALSDLCFDAGVQTGQGGGLPTGGVYSGPGITDDGNGMTYSFDPVAAGVGTHTVTYVFADTNSCGGSATDDVEIFALDDAGFNYNTSVFFTGGSDPSPTITGLTGGSFSSSMGLDIAANGVIDVSESTPGMYMVTYITTGDCPNSSTANITISESNNAPSFDLPMSPNQTVLEDAGAQTVNMFATNIDDNNVAVQVLTFNVSNDDNALFSVQPDIDESTGSLTYTPAANAFGSATVTVSLSDDGGTANGGVNTSGDQTFIITVNQVNNTPVVITGITSDTGVSNLDFVTNDNTLSVSGTAEPNSIITFAVDGNPIPVFIASAVTNSAGVFEYINQGGLPDGTASFVATSSLNGVTLNSAPQSVTVDTTDPTVMISTTSSDPTDDNPIPVTITFSQEVGVFEASDITVSNGSVQDFSTVDNTIFVFNLVPSSSGLVEASISAGSTTDIAGNDNEVSNTLSLEYSPTLSNETFSLDTLVFIETVVENELVIKGGVEVISVEIFDLSGALVANSTNVSGLTSGIYIAVVTTEKGVITEKVVKK